MAVDPSRAPNRNWLLPDSRLRTLMTACAEKIDLPLLIAPPAYCTDNAAMIAGLGYYQLAAGERSELNLDANPRVPNLGRIPALV